LTRLRAVIADDTPLIRDALSLILRQNGVEVVAAAADGDQARVAVVEHLTDVAILDVRMPPHNHLDGLHAAIDIRNRFPDVAVVLLSAHVESRYVDALLGTTGGVGYLLKDRIAGAAEFVAAVHRVVGGECVIDPEVIAALMRPIGRDPLVGLSERERQVLALMAEGRSNSAIAERLALTVKTIETHISHIFATLALGPTPEDHRRVLAVLAYLR
jgi:DNA-binding NarL/FixJ family response regulator